jgi:hypothetical protein
VSKSCQGFATTSILFHFGKFPALIPPKDSKGYAEFGMTFNVFLAV